MKKLKQLLKNPVFNIGLIIVITALVLLITLRNNGPEVLGMLRKVSVPMVVLIAGLLIAERWIHGWGLASETRVSHPHYTNFQGMINAYTAGFFNNITPSASGGQFAQVYLFRRQGVLVSSSIGVLWLDFIIYQTTMSVVVLILLLLRFHYFFSNYSQYFIIVLLGFMINSAVIVFLWMLVKFPKFYHWITTTGMNIGYRLHLVRSKEEAKRRIDEQLKRFDIETKRLSNHKKMIIGVAFSDVLRLWIYYSIPFLCALALHLKVTGSDYLNMVALASFVSMINAFLPMPGSSGGTEATFVLMYSTLFGKMNAATIMLLWRFMTYYFQTLAGGLCFIYGKIKREVPRKEISWEQDKS